MKVTLKSFKQLADTSRFSWQAIVMGKDGPMLGNRILPSDRETNIYALKIFCRKLVRKYGLIGKHVFDTVLGSRMLLRKSLRVCDVKTAFLRIGEIREKRYLGELGRQLDTDPKMLELSDDMQKKVRQVIEASPFDRKKINKCIASSDINRMAAKRIEAAIACAHRIALTDKKRGVMIDTTVRPIEMNMRGKLASTANEPIGLSNLTLMFGKGETSVGDLIKKGTLGTGMRINRSATNPVLLEKLKVMGVEPGFLYKCDWSLEDTKSLMADTNASESQQALEELKKEYPELTAKCAELSFRRQIMLFGRAHPAAMAAVAEYMLEKDMEDKNSVIFTSFCEKYPDKEPSQWTAVGIHNVKKSLFVAIRDTIMGVKQGDPAYETSPIFKHFAERHILKFDYNEGDRIFSYNAASSGRFMRPKRSSIRRKWLGKIFRLAMAKTALELSVRAVTEALANDLARIAGVPAQELTIVRGQYSDGYPKLMLEAAFAEGYKNLGGGYLIDGQIVPPQGEQVESLGKYKAFFLAVADRDAVGFSGKNKGFVNGRFFAIDPGHSLEGDSRFLHVYDNLSFKDSHRFSFTPRFSNFSVFDDDTRFSKLRGMLDLRALKESGKIERLFDEYRAAFDPDEKEISSAEKNLRIRIHATIKKKEKEFNDSLSKILAVAESQFKFYDALAEEGAVVQERAIETIDNLEKLTSPTTWVSPKGLVPLRHLSVINKDRVTWSGHVDNDKLIYHCSKPLSPQRQSLLKMFSAAAGATLHMSTEEGTSVVFLKSNCERAFSAFSEMTVAAFTHPEESTARAKGESSQKEASLS